MGKLTDILTRPLTRKRKYLALQENLAHGLILTAATGCNVTALGATVAALSCLMGNLALPTLIVLYGAKKLKDWHHKATRKAETDLTIEETVSPALPLANDLARTFMRHTNMQAPIDYTRSQSYMAIHPGLKGPKRIELNPAALLSHYKFIDGRDSTPDKLQQFSTQVLSVLAHERGHVTSRSQTGIRALLYHLFSPIPLAFATSFCLAATGAAMGLLHLAGASVNAEWLSMLVLGGTGFASSYGARLATLMSSRLGEYRADREAALLMGRAAPLAELLAQITQEPASKPFAFLNNLHPDNTARRTALIHFDCQLTESERTAGARNVERIFAEVAARHPNAFQQKPADACPAGVLTRHILRNTL